MQSPYVLNHCNAEPLQTLTYIVKTSKRSNVILHTLVVFLMMIRFSYCQIEMKFQFSICIAFITGGKVRQIQRGGANVLIYIAKYREKSSYQKLARKAEACIVQKHTQIVQIECVQIMIHGVWVGRRYFYFTQKKTQKRNLQKSTSQNQLARQSVTCVKASLDIEQSQVCLNGDTLVIQNESTMG